MIVDDYQMRKAGQNRAAADFCKIAEASRAWTTRVADPVLADALREAVRVIGRRNGRRCSSRNIRAQKAGTIRTLVTYALAAASLWRY
ncbi:hypothetical protein SLG_07820 [Sphingobium sp. SYK-6]|uniref:hypothetical protein n=1 Tax=Sphingobium sp. (strain NBRC 103272 / SYK-6) TaxID=627192 RepID=UPI0002276B48|nr:hypothetical protein [Sphingobium sp. SYK-6]BAK65457.1 hypothetical protein SLG_07820 [Sphingobium sp. SYK-6]